MTTRAWAWHPAMLGSALSWAGEHKLLLLALALVTLLILMRGYRRLRRVMRRRRPVRLHPKLQKYGAEHAQPTEALIQKRRIEAEHIIATSSTGAIAGYEIVEQVEAVYVDGFIRPEDALEGLKAVAAMKGANAVTNVKRERGSDRRCSASGDAVIVKRMAGIAATQPARGDDPTDEDLVDDLDEGGDRI
jgi:uncharacterized protein YbjQ (UPF0145 family)